jgi:hypothetical protein
MAQTDEMMERHDVEQRVATETMARSRFAASGLPHIPRRSAVAYIGAVCAWLLVCEPAHVRAFDAEEYTVDVRLDDDHRRVEGTWRVTGTVDPGEREVSLWVYADRLAVTPKAMDERTQRWIFPREVSLGGTSVRAVRAGGVALETRVVPVGGTTEPAHGNARRRDAGGSDLLVTLPPGLTGRVTLELEFSVEIPERFGRLGRVGDHWTLGAPWYPLVVQGDAVASEALHRVRVSAAAGRELVAAGVPARSGEWASVRGTFLPVVSAPRFHRYGDIVGASTSAGRATHGAGLRILSAGPLYSPPPASALGVERLESIVDVDVEGLLLAAYRDVRATLAAELGALPARPLTVALVPLRTEIVATAPGMVLVSDRVFEIFPVDVTREFHVRAVKRAFFRALVRDLSRGEHDGDRDWVDDLRAVILTDLDVARRNGTNKRPDQIVGFAAFHPAVDQFLYAPQVSFVDVYFGSVDEPDLFRDDPARARLDQARGRRLLESARDFLPPAAFAAFVRNMLGGTPTVAAALEAASPGAGARLPGWVASVRRPVNYRLGKVATTRTASGYTHRIEILRLGANRREPVEVMVLDEDGHQTWARWDGDGDRGEVVVQTKAALDNVRIDPRGRLPQSPSLAAGHPRGDDALSLDWRPPLLRSFGFNVLASEGDVSGFVNFALRRKYDIENVFDFTASRAPDSTSFVARYAHGFGPKLHDNARSAAVAGGLRLDRLSGASFAGGTGAWRPSVVASVGTDTRVFFLDPRAGESIGVSARVGPAFRDDGETRLTGSVGLRGSYTLGLGLRNVLVGVVGGGATFGDALAAEYQGLGGRFLLRGYDTSEVLGRVAFFGVIEHRLTVLSDLSWNIVHLAWLREIQLATFTGAGVALDALGTDSTVPAFEVGGGVRFHFEYGGVQPAVLSVDLGVPLVRDGSRLGADGLEGAQRSSYALHIAFDQYF